MRVRYPILLISKVVPVDAFLSQPIAINDSPALHHKAGDNSVEKSIAIVEVALLLASAERPEILNRLGHFFREQFKHNAAQELVTNCDVHVGLWMVCRKLRHHEFCLLFFLIVEAGTRGPTSQSFHLFFLPLEFLLSYQVVEPAALFILWL